MIDTKPLLSLLFLGSLLHAQDSAIQESSSTLRPNQSPVSTAPPVPLGTKERLIQLDQTFQENLATLHLPLLKTYVEQLQQLKLDYTSQGKLTEIALIDIEIENAKKLIAEEKGLPMEIQDHSTKSFQPTSTAFPEDTSKVVLNAAQATGAAVNSPSVPLGNTSWSIQDLKPGSYQVNMVYSAPNIASPYQIRWSALDQSSTNQIPLDELRSSEMHYRILALGILNVLDSSPTNFQFTLENLAPFGPPIQVRHLILSKTLPE